MSSGKPIFSEAGRARFTNIELGYLTHIVFRVLSKHKPAADKPPPTATRTADNLELSEPRPARQQSASEPPPEATAAANPASSYVVQILVSPGIDHHQIVCDAATSGHEALAAANLSEALAPAQVRGEGR